MSSSHSAIPSSTEYFGALFTNLGPLTTTYTAPESCETVNTGRVWFVDAESNQFPLGRPECHSYWSFGECIPSGTAIDEWVEVAKTSTGDTNNGANFYHSPGIYCPEGWSTVGAIAKDNGTLSVSGFMTGWYEGYSSFSFPTTEPRYMGMTEQWNGFLKPSQTVAFCGPSGYTVDPLGRCSSTLGAYTDFDYKTWCEWVEGEVTVPDPKTYYSVPGNTYEAGYLSYVPPTTRSDSKSKNIEPINFAPDDLERLVVVTWIDVVPIVFEQTDLDAATVTAAASTGATETNAEATETGATNSRETDVEETGGSSPQITDSAATSLSTAGLIPVMAVLVSMLAAVGAFAPW